MALITVGEGQNTAFQLFFFGSEWCFDPSMGNFSLHLGRKVVRGRIRMLT